MPERILSTYPLGLTAAIVVGLASFVATFLVKLYKARMLLIDRRRRGLVSSAPPAH